MTDPGPSIDERAEIDRLRRKVAGLEAAPAAGDGRDAEPDRVPPAAPPTGMAVSADPPPPSTADQPALVSTDARS